MELGVPVRRRPPRRPRARPRGRPQPPPDHPRRRQRDRPPDPARAVGARPSSTPAIEVLEGHRAAGDPRQAAASRLEDGRDLTARATILATGGAAALWSRTTNPPGSFGSGLLLGRAARARMLADLEFTQFHPTAVVGLKGREGFLISEAVRGEGATLHGPDGERFVDELDPRDAVARAIFNLLQRTGAKSVGLDMTMVDPGRFPNIVAALQEAGLDPTTAARPDRPRQPLRDGRDRHRPRRARDRRRAPLRRRRVRLHRPARRQPARVELAQRVLRVRPPRGARRASTSRRRASRAVRRRRRSRRRRARPARPSGRSPAWSATRRTSTTLADDPYPLARLVAASRAGARTRRAARTPAPSSRSSTRARRAPHDPRPRQRHPALRAVALLIDWGGVLTTSMMGSFDAFGAPRGLSDVRTAFREDPTLARRLDRARDRRDRHRRRSKRRLGAALGVDPHGPRAAGSRTRSRPDDEMLDAVTALPRPRHPHRAGLELVARGRLRRRRPVRRRSCSPERSASASPTRGSTTSPLERLGVAADRCVFVDDLGGNLKPAKALGMTTIRHDRGSDHDPPARTPTFAVESFLTRSQQTRRSSFRVCGKHSRTGPRKGTAAGEGSPGETAMYHFSRSIYRELAPDIIEDRGARRDHEPRARPALVRALRRAARHGLALLRQADEDAVQRHPDLLPDVGAAAGLQDRAIAT